jgi:hypothetical protein
MDVVYGETSNMRFRAILASSAELSGTNTRLTTAPSTRLSSAQDFFGAIDALLALLVAEKRIGLNRGCIHIWSGDPDLLRLLDQVPSTTAKAR